MTAPKHARRLSVVIPVLNEQDSLKQLCEEVVENAARSVKEGRIAAYEIWFVDDGSTDASPRIISDLAGAHEQVNAIFFRKNFGKACALQAGFRHAGGDLVLTMDADLQDNPLEISRFISAADKGFDLVSGWKVNRRDSLEKRLPSKVFNSVICKLFGIRLHDCNCGFKLYRKELADSLDIYGGMHRYIPVLAASKGFRITEIAVAHRKRAFGKSKYGWGRYFHGFFDLLMILFLTRYGEKPMHFFGKAALVLLGIGFCLALYGVAAGSFYAGMLAVLCVVSGVHFFGLGFIAEALLNASYHSRYTEDHIREIICKKEKKTAG